MNKEDLEDEIYTLFHPELEEGLYPGEIAHPRLEADHKLDVSYLRNMVFDYEGSSMHPTTRLCPIDAEELQILSQNVSVTIDLFDAGLKLFADSILEYYEKTDRQSELRYYPPIILTFWSAFETFIRYSSELMLNTAKNIPHAINMYLREQKEIVDDNNGIIRIKTNYQSVLNRYYILLYYGFNYKIDKGNKHWQNLGKAKQLRDYYTHVNVNNARSISTKEVIEFMESILLSIIWPSTEIKHTLLLHVYYIYEKWVFLMEKAQNYTEKPFHLGWILREPYMFYCPFENVDANRFPNSKEQLEKKMTGS